ncbi:MAG: hypothetical protein IJ112_05275 [Oscillospiraceae bacterium]|nr:hypothetical protein [Oscillospiraceae bacterium]
MNQHMEENIERTIKALQASMPKQKKKQASIATLLRIAASEMSNLFLITLFAGVLLFGIMCSKFLSMPLLTVFCTAPMPMLLLFHVYVLRGNVEMRELEETFQYSYSEMIIGRVTIISCYMTFSLLALSFILYRNTGENFIRLALCGAVPSLYLCALMLLITSVCRSQENISLIAISIWAAMCFSALIFPFNDLLQVCSTMLYAALVFVGFGLYGACLIKVRNRRPKNAIRTV